MGILRRVPSLLQLCVQALAKKLLNDDEGWPDRKCSLNRCDTSCVGKDNTALCEFQCSKHVKQNLRKRSGPHILCTFCVVSILRSPPVFTDFSRAKRRLPYVAGDVGDRAQYYVRLIGKKLYKPLHRSGL